MVPRATRPSTYSRGTPTADFNWKVGCWIPEHPVLGAAALLAVAAVPSILAIMLGFGPEVPPLVLIALFDLWAVGGYAWVHLTIGRFARDRLSN